MKKASMEKSVAQKYQRLKKRTKTINSFFLLAKLDGVSHCVVRKHYCWMDENEENQTINEKNFQRVQEIISILQTTGNEERQHIWNTVGTWFNLKSGVEPTQSRPATVYKDVSHASTANSHPHDDKISFSNRVEMSPKEFLNEKMPTTDVERIACLAYYLTHYRETPDFKTADMTKLNTEAAQRKLSNPTVAAKNAIQGNYLIVSSKKGHRQLSAMGEQYVNALPDRDDANSIRRRMIPQKSKPRKASKKISV